jgi:hypothetical protein
VKPMQQYVYSRRRQQPDNGLLWFIRRGWRVQFNP